MAGTTTSTGDFLARESAERDLAVQHNKHIDDSEVLRAGLAALAASFNLLLAKLDADAGVSDTNYASTRTVTVTTYDGAGDMTAAKIGDRAGTALS